ncbi:MAG: radical SAM protein [Actinomycetota bacterium]|nr:radical SAM protein [Actinomycetota bacterium]
MIVKEEIPSRITLESNSGVKVFDVIAEPAPHIIVEGSRKELHGWWSGKRECTAERMLINPYNGCTHNCPFCYARAFWGYFQLFHERGVVTVFKDFDMAIAHQLDGIDVASCGYLSPVTDPFQLVNDKYRLSEKIIREFVFRNIPIEFVTKGAISDEAIELVRGQKHSFGQVSILTLDENLRKHLVPGGASTRTLFDNLRRLSAAGVYAVCRVDPVIPNLTDGEDHLRALIKKAASFGARHIVASCLDIPWKIKKDAMEALSIINSAIPGLYSRLYTEDIGGYLNADIRYRRRLFSVLRRICDGVGLTFSLCMEYELVGGRPMGLNREFMSSFNCEGMDVPIYVRKGDHFEPVTDCRGNCLFCTDPRCGIEYLAMGREGSKKDWKLEDYRRWSRELVAANQRGLFN